MTNEERKELETVKRFHEISTRCAFGLYDTVADEDIRFFLSQLIKRDKRIAQLEFQLATIRADTIEECARVCDVSYESTKMYTYRGLAADFRKLATNQPIDKTNQTVPVEKGVNE